MTSEWRPERLVRSRLPQTDGLVGAGRCQERAIGAERHAVHRVVVSTRQLELLLAFGDIPQDDGLVVTSGSQQAPVRAERDAVDAKPVTSQGLAEWLASGKVPKNNTVKNTTLVL